MNRFEKSTRPKAFPNGGMSTSSTSEDTIFPKAAPRITPIAKSKTLPRMANSLNSLNTVILLSQNASYSGARERMPMGGGGLNGGDYIRTRSALPQNEQRTDDAASDQHGAGENQQRKHSIERHARHRQHDQAQQHQRAATVPLLPLFPELRRPGKGQGSPGDQCKAQHQPCGTVAIKCDALIDSKPHQQRAQQQKHYFHQ